MVASRELKPPVNDRPYPVLRTYDLHSLSLVVG